MSSAENTSLAAPTRFIACHDCDLLHHPPELDDGEVASCGRCGARLRIGGRHARQRALAYLTASLILLVTANVLPFLSLSIAGSVRENRLITGVVELYAQGFHFLSAAVLVACIVAPLLTIAGLLLVITPRHGSFRVRKWLDEVKRWGMLDVFLLGVLVALIKLSDLAEIGLERGFFAYLALVVVSTMAAISSSAVHE